MQSFNKGGAIFMYFIHCGDKKFLAKIKGVITGEKLHDFELGEYDPPTPPTPEPMTESRWGWWDRDAACWNTRLVGCVGVLQPFDTFQVILGTVS